MIEWIKRKLGITNLKHRTETLEEVVRLLSKRNRQAWDVLEKVKRKVDKKSMRYDEIERARKRRKKGWKHEKKEA